MSKVYIFDYKTEDRGSDCFPDYLDSVDAAKAAGLAMLDEHVPDAVAWSIRRIGPRGGESIVARGVL
jgi:hypothetical protein